MEGSVCGARFASLPLRTPRFGPFCMSLLNGRGGRCKWAPSGSSLMSGNSVDFRHRPRIEGKVPGFDVLLDLFELGRAGDDARYFRMGEEPAEGKVEKRAAACLGDLLQLLDTIPIALGHIALREPFHIAEAAILRHRRPALIFAGQKAARERIIGQEPEAIGADRRQQFFFGIADQHAVLVLAGDEGVQAGLARGPERLDHLPGDEIGATDVAHLALMDEIVERPRSLLDRCRRVWKCN